MQGDSGSLYDISLFGGRIISWGEAIATLRQNRCRWGGAMCCPPSPLSSLLSSNHPLYGSVAESGQDDGDSGGDQAQELPFFRLSSRPLGSPKIQARSTSPGAKLLDYYSTCPTWLPSVSFPDRLDRTPRRAATREE